VLNVPNPLPTVDGLLAATALEHDLTLVTRNTRDFASTGVRILDPFSDSPTHETRRS
jgi:predicted nucleic acid-binding protein